MRAEHCRVAPPRLSFRTHERPDGALGGLTIIDLLGCREDVVPFYESCGWRRIAAPERHIDRLSGEVVEKPPGPPLLILPITLALEDWPSGMIDLRGRPW